MVCITFVEYNGAAHSVDAQAGMTLMEAAYWNSIKGILADCGGDGGCATCHVYLNQQWDSLAGEISARERRTLRFALNSNAASRLACFIKLREEMDGLSVHMPERQF